MHQQEAKEVLQPPSNRPFSIHVPNSVWLVRSGNLDLFAMRTVNHELSGAREHILRVQEGGAVLGIPPIEDAGISIVATATPGTELRLLSQAALRDRSQRVNSQIDALGILEGWISAISAAASAAISPNRFTELRADLGLEIGDEPKPLMPAKGVVWINHHQGSSRFLSRSETARINPGEYFPVSAYGWIDPEPNSTIVSVSSEEWEKADPEWRSLGTFHRAILQCLVSNQRKRDEKYRSRITNQYVANAAIIRGALATLASPLDRGSLQLPFDEDIASPAFRACEAAGKALGVNIVRPPQMSDSMELKDAVATIARTSALRYRVVALKGKWWKSPTSPLVACSDHDRRPFALLPGRKNGCELYDPVENKTMPVDEALAATVNGFAYMFYRPLPAGKLSLWELLKFSIRGSSRELVTILIMGIAAGLLGMAVPIAIGIIFNSIIPGAHRTQLVEICVFLAFIAVATSVFTLTQSLAILRLEGKVGFALQAAIWDRLLRLPTAFFRRYTSGDLANRSMGIGSVVHMLTLSGLASVVSAVFTVFSFFLLFYYNSKLALVALVLVLVAVAVSGVSIYFQVRYQRQIFRSSGKIAGMLLQFVENVAKLRLAGSEARAFAAWARQFSVQKELSIRARKVSNGFAVFSAAFPVVSLAVIFGYSANLIGPSFSQGLTAGILLAFLSAFAQFQSAVLSLSSTLQSVLGIIPLYERSAPILETLPEVTEANKQPGELTGAIEVNHVEFRYTPNAPLILHDFSLSVRPGEFVAFVGPSGSGKSTVLRLLVGFEKPESGAVYYDGQDLAGLDIPAVRRQLGVVIQNARLGTGSIFDNIVGSSGLSLQDAWEAAARAGLDQDIREMPMGMYTLVSEGGGNLSGGQRQRLLIARAMVKKPRVFLFDEATSALDNQTQAIVSRSLEAVQATRIVIAHRLSTIARADRVVVMQRGVIVQTGSYRELADQDGLFRELAKRQLV